MTEPFTRDLEGVVLADLMLASTPRTLLKRLVQNDILRRAQKGLTPEGIDAYLQRAETLLSEETPEGYAHPDELIIAAYAYVIGGSPSPSVRAFLTRMAGTCRKDVSAVKDIAHFLLERTPTNERTDKPPSPQEWSEVARRKSDDETRTGCPEDGQPVFIFPAISPYYARTTNFCSL